MMLIAGCHHPDAQKTVAHPATGPSLLTVTIKPMIDGDSRDPQPAPAAMVRLTIFLLDLPPHSVSDNSDFWKRVDEQAVGAANSDRLLRNGIRCGVVPQTESAYFSQFFDSQPHKLSTSRVDGVSAETFPLQMEKQFDHQDLFFFNTSNELEGRTYDRGSNQLMLSFGLAPRDSNAVRLTLCPVVRSEKTQMTFTPLNQEFESTVNSEDHLYDLGLTADVSDGSFLVIAPGPDADRSSSMGNRFLTKSDGTEKKEQVIVIVPTILQLDGKPVQLREALIK
jgi:hypothetical protein